jgi:hypothetical protein
MVATTSRTNANRTRREMLGQATGSGNAARGASGGPRHVSQILPDVLARYGITPEAMEQSAAAGRRRGAGRSAAPALELATDGASWAAAVS